MTFEGQYLTYEEYVNLGGSPFGEMPFNILEFEARRQIDIRTQNRLKNVSVIPDEVKMCTYKLINSINNYSNNENNASSNNIANESIDGYSVSYISPSEITSILKSKHSEIDDIIFTYLTNVIVNNEHLVYLGVK